MQWLYVPLFKIVLFIRKHRIYMTSANEFMKVRWLYRRQAVQTGCITCILYIAMYTVVYGIFVRMHCYVHCIFMRFCIKKHKMASYSDSRGMWFASRVLMNLRQSAGFKGKMGLKYRCILRVFCWKVNVKIAYFVL